MILEFDDKGLVDMDFRRVDYDVAAELQLAKDLKLPYFEVYYTLFSCNVNHYHPLTRHLIPCHSPLSGPILSEILDDEYDGYH